MLEMPGMMLLCIINSFVPFVSAALSWYIFVTFIGFFKRTVPIMGVIFSMLF